MISFEQIANKKWIAAQQITGIHFGTGKQEGNEYLFKNPFTQSDSYGSFRFLQNKQVFMDMTQSGMDMHITPEKFVSQSLGISTRESWELLKKTCGDWTESHNYVSIPKAQTSQQPKIEEEKEPFSFEGGLKNETYLTRVVVLNCLIEQLAQHNSKQEHFPQQLIDFLEKKRSLNVELISRYENLFQVYDWSTIANLKNGERLFTIEQLRHAGLIKPNSLLPLNPFDFYWIGNDYLLIFPCLYPYFNSNLQEWQWYVTGIRARRTCKKDSPKDAEIPILDELKKLEFPSSVGWYGLQYWSNRYPSVLNKCENLNVIIVEGVMDMLAAMEIVTADKTIILAIGVISRAFHSINIELISKCKVLFIAFDDDFSAKKNTGQCSASALKAHLNDLGMSQVEIFPKKFYQGQKDFNDLLNFIKKQKDHRQNGLQKGA